MKVRDIMTTKVVSIRQDTPVREVAQTLGRYRISGAPVCDEQGHLVGVVSEYDLIAHPDAAVAREVMSSDVISVMEDTEVDEVRFLLVNRKIKRVPVVQRNKVVGIVSRADLVREIALTWVCQVCGDAERGQDPPETCPKCGVPSGYHPSTVPPVGEGAEVPPQMCPTCGQPLAI